MGSIYKPKLKSGGESSVWWLSYHANGKRFRESSGTESRRQAEDLLKEREGRVVGGLPIIPRADKITYEAIAEDLVTHYRATGDRDLSEAGGRLRHLGAFFAGWRVVNITPDQITAYIVKRQGEGAANGTINRELGVLGRMLRLAVRNGKLTRLPDFRDLKPKESAPRSGFFEDHQYEAIRRHLPDDLKLAVTLAHTYGWRTQSEVLTLQLAQLDLEAGTLRLNPGTTKNDDGPLVYLTPELKPMLAAQTARVKALQHRLGKIVPDLFVHQTSKVPGLVGTPIRDFRKAWRTACRRAGVPGAIRHDFRRTAVRNLVASGVPERVAMTVTGHRTRSVFDRYHIVSTADLQEAARKLAARS
jgi:integrase